MVFNYSSIHLVKRLKGSMTRLLMVENQDISTTIESRQKLESQLQENKIVQKVSCFPLILPFSEHRLRNEYRNSQY